MSTLIRLLYIDDDAGLGQLARKALRGDGFEVHAVQTGAEAIALLEQQPFDLVALDHDLGGETGLDVLAAIQRMPGAPPVIYVTGSDDARIAVAALKAGAVDYVWKDVSGHYRELLVQAGQTALAQRRLEEAKAAAERQVREGRDRAEMLLGEVNHRIANSLAMVAAFAAMQARQLEDDGGRAALREMQTRIAAIAGIHKRLYTSHDVRRVELAPYFTGLAEEISAALTTSENPPNLILDVDPALEVSTDHAVSLGVAVTELVTNAIKYAYPSSGGDIQIGLRRKDEKTLRLIVADQGAGFDTAAPSRGSGLGTRIVRAMTQSLHGELAYDTTAGTRVFLDFPG